MYGNTERFLPEFFWTSKSSLLELDKEYIVQHPKEIIAAEMNKKEKRNTGIEEN